MTIELALSAIGKRVDCAVIRGIQEEERAHIAKIPNVESALILRPQPNIQRSIDIAHQAREKSEKDNPVKQRRSLFKNRKDSKTDAASAPMSSAIMLFGPFCGFSERRL